MIPTRPKLCPPVIITMLPRRVEQDQINVCFVEDRSENTSVEFDVILNFARGDIDLDRIVRFDVGIRVANGSCIVGDQVRDLLGTHTE